MEIRIRETGMVLSDIEFRRLYSNTSIPKHLSESLLDSLGADIVFEGPRSIQTEAWQYSVRDGVELIGGKWYTKYINGPVLATQEEQNVYVTEWELKRLQSVKRSIIDQVQKRLNDFAATKNYYSIDSIAKYTGITDQDILDMPESIRASATSMRDECRYLAKQVASTWASCYKILSDVDSGVREVPSGFSDIVGDLPELEWPV